MKKTLSILVITVLVLILGMSSASAVTSFTAAAKPDATSVAQGGTVNVTVSLSGFTPGETGINAFIGVINYDKKVFDTIKTADITPAGGWAGLVYNESEGIFTVTNAKFVSDNHDILKIKLTVKDNATIGATTITFKGLNAADGENDIYPKDATTSVTITEKSTPTPTPTPSVTPTPTKAPSTTPTPTATQALPKTGEIGRAHV